MQVDAAAHAQQLVDLHEETATYRYIFSGPFPRAEALQRWSAHTGPVVLALRDHDPVGFAAAAGDTLQALYVLPAEAGAGVGTALLREICLVTRLWVLEQNTRGRGFYERRGWHWSGVARAATDAGDVTELLYARQLTAGA